MIRLSVIRESLGWSVQLDGMKSPFRSRKVAIAAAHRIAANISRHGEHAEVIAEEDVPGEQDDPACKPAAPWDGGPVDTRRTSP